MVMKMSDRSIQFSNECILNGIIKKPPVFRKLVNDSEQCIVVLETIGLDGNHVNLRLVSFDQAVIDSIKAIGLQESDAVRVQAILDVVRWLDIRSQTNKSRQSVIIQRLEKQV